MNADRRRRTAILGIGVGASFLAALVTASAAATRGSGVLWVASWVLLLAAVTSTILLGHHWKRTQR